MTETNLMTKQRSKLLYSPSFTESFFGNSTLIQRIFGEYERFYTAENINKVDLSGVTSITFIGHSGSNLLTLQENKTVSDYTPQQLARDIARKYSDPDDRKKLLDFYLISCEAGLVLPNGSSFADEFYKEMYQLGFTSLKVHAMRSVKGSMTGMIVQTTVMQSRSDDMTITAWNYATPEAEARDVELEKEKTQLEQSLEKASGNTSFLSSFYKSSTKQPTRNMIDEVRQKINDIKEEQDRLRLYVCINRPVLEAFDRSSNTITTYKPDDRLSMSIETSLAITWLRDKFLDILKENADQRTLPFVIQETLDELYRSPDRDAAEVLGVFEEKWAEETMYGLFGMADSTQYKAIKNDFSQYLSASSKKYNLTTVNISTTKESIQHLKSFFQRFWHIFFERSPQSAFNLQMQQLQRHLIALDKAKEQEKAALTDISNYTKQDKVELINEMKSVPKDRFKSPPTWGEWVITRMTSSDKSRVQNQFERKLTTFTKKDSLTSRDIPWINDFRYLADHTTPKLQQLVEKLDKTEELIRNKRVIESSQVKPALKKLQTELQEKLNSYWASHQKKKTPMHDEKCELVEKLITFVSNIGKDPAQTNAWKTVDDFINDNTKKLWKSGLASETKLLKDEVEALSNTFLKRPQ